MQFEPEPFHFQDSKSEKGEQKEVNGVKEEEEEEDDEDDEEEDEDSSDPDIEEEIQASARQEGAGESSSKSDSTFSRKFRRAADVFGLSTDEVHEDGDDEDDHVCNGTSKDDRADEPLGLASAGEEESLPDEDEEPATSGVSPRSSESKSHKSPLSNVASPGRSPVPPESTQTDHQKPPSDREEGASEEPVESHNPSPGIAAATADGPPLPAPPGGLLDKGCGQICNGTSQPPNPRLTRSQKRKREEEEGSPGSPQTAAPAQDR